jgi:hypothetical protein
MAAKTLTKTLARTWVTRFLVLTVFAINLHCVISFIFTPERSLDAFELAGVPGTVAIQGIGIAFLMWNATYPLVIFNPRKYRALFVVVLVQQIIGLVGESIIYLALPAGHQVLGESILRFIVFDAAGLLLLAVGFALTLKRFANSCTTKDRN